MRSERTGVDWGNAFYMTWYEGRRWVHTHPFETLTAAEDKARLLSGDNWPTGIFTCFVTEGMPKFDWESGKLVSTWKHGKRVEVA